MQKQALLQVLDIPHPPEHDGPLHPNTLALPIQVCEHAALVQPALDWYLHLSLQELSTHISEQVYVIQLVLQLAAQPLQELYVDAIEYIMIF